MIPFLREMTSLYPKNSRIFPVVLLLPFPQAHMPAAFTPLPAFLFSYDVANLQVIPLKSIAFLSHHSIIRADIEKRNRGGIIHDSILR